MNDPIPFHRPSIGPDEEAAVLRVLRSGWLTTGAEAAAFEAELAAFLGVPAEHVVAVSSCTAALHLAGVLGNVQARPGFVRERVTIVPTLTFTATAAAMEQAGGEVVFADVDPEMMMLSFEEVERARRITEVAAVVPVHYGGNPSRFAALAKEAKARGWVVIEDAAHVLGAEYDRSDSDFLCLSFYPTKPITTAEGGALVCRATADAQAAREMALHGIDQDAYQRSRAGLYHYEVAREGWKYNLPDLLAALGRAQLARAEALWDQRYEIACAYVAYLMAAAQADLVSVPVVESGVKSSFHLFAVRLNVDRMRVGWDRDRVAAALRERGIGTSLHYRPLHLHPYWTPRVLPGQVFPHAERAYRELLSLPIWPDMTGAMVERVAMELVAVLREASR